MALTAAAVPAGAAPAASPTGTTISSTRPMTLHHVVKFAATPTGEALTLDDGHVPDVPADGYAAWLTAHRNAAAHPQPNETKNSNCDSSTLTFIATGNHHGQMGTEFVLNVIHAVYRGWYVSFVDNFGATR